MIDLRQPNMQNGEQPCEKIWFTVAKKQNVKLTMVNGKVLFTRMEYFSLDLIRQKYIQKQMR